MISPRYLPVVALCLALAAIPTVIHGYVGWTSVDGRRVSTLPQTLAGMQGIQTRRTAGYVEEAYGTTEFIERDYGSSLTLFVARSFDAKGLYHHPENGVAHGDGYDRVVVIRSPERPDIPRFVLQNHRDRYSTYALLYAEDTFIDNPVRFQLEHALRLLVRPRQALTLFFVRAKSAQPQIVAAADALLFSAIDAFVRQSVSGGS